MKKIVFGITDLSVGGAEKTLIDLCNTLCNRYDITIFTLYGNGKLEKELNTEIKIINIYKKSFEEINFINKKFISFKTLFLKKYFYNKYIKNKFDVEIAFLEGPITTLFSIKNKTIKKIAWIHTDISLIFGNGLKSKIKKIINKKIYNNYNKLIFVSQNSLEKFNNIYNISVKKHVINNYIDYDKILKLSEENINFEFDKNIINFLSISRLVSSKAIDRLIRIHNKLIEDGFYHKIYVIGDGPERNNLKSLIEQFNVQDTFILLGEIQNPYPYIKSCDYFCLLSYYEGFPMVLLEAKGLKKYIIITDTSSKETLENYNLKQIVENSENGIYNGLKEIITNNTKIQLNTTNIDKDNLRIIKKIIKIIEE